MYGLLRYPESWYYAILSAMSLRFIPLHEPYIDQLPVCVYVLATF